MCLIAARCLQGKVQRIRNIAGLHGRAQLPGDDITRVIIEVCRQVHPAPSNDFQNGFPDDYWRMSFLVIRLSLEKLEIIDGYYSDAREEFGYRLTIMEKPNIRTEPAELKGTCFSL